MRTNKLRVWTGRNGIVTLRDFVSVIFDISFGAILLAILLGGFTLTALSLFKP